MLKSAIIRSGIRGSSATEFVSITTENKCSLKSKTSFKGKCRDLNVEKYPCDSWCFIHYRCDNREL